MITRVPDPSDYHNIIQDAVGVLHDEAIYSLEYIGVYFPEDNTWNFRKMFWFIVALMPAAVFLLAIFLASVKYLIWN